MNNTEDLRREFEGIPTPFYYYDLSLLETTLYELKTEAELYNYQVHYALKANANNEILQRVIDHGFGADCVSGNEIRHAVRAGFSPDNIVFAGVGKTDEEILLALDHGIACFNCESVEEIIVINELAKQKSGLANIALRINPDLNANTHEYITTGKKENKFGLNSDDIESIIRLLPQLSNIKLTGLHFHIGSQILDLQVYQDLCLKVNNLQNWFEARNIFFEHINLGGGLGIDYEQPGINSIPDFKGFFGIINRNLEVRPGQTIHFEPGRSIVGQCGNLITKVLYVKNAKLKNFAIVDAGFTELIRPALYQSYHKIENLSSCSESRVYDVVGPICESSDCFGTEVILPETRRGDLIAIRSAGAYGEVMSSGYNLRSAASAYYSTDFGLQTVDQFSEKHHEMALVD